MSREGRIFLRTTAAGRRCCDVQFIYDTKEYTSPQASSKLSKYLPPGHELAQVGSTS
jgi:hypothetical protein